MSARGEERAGELSGSGTRTPGRAIPWLLAAPATIGMVVFFLVPLGIFFVYSFLTSGLFQVGLPLTLQNYADTLTTPLNATLAKNSLIIGVLAASACVTFGIPVAFWLRFSAGRLRLPVLSLITASLFASYLVRIYAWRSILGTNGLLNRGLQLLGVIDRPLEFLLFNRFSVIVALVHIYLPVVVLIAFGGFGSIPISIVEASQDLGSNAFERWRRILLPLIAAPATTAFLLVFVLSVGDYVTPQLIGGADGAMLGIQIQADLKALGNWGRGAATSFLLLAGFVVLYGVVAFGLRRARLDRIHWGT